MQKVSVFALLLVALIAPAAFADDSPLHETPSISEVDGPFVVPLEDEIEQVTEDGRPVQTNIDECKQCAMHEVFQTICIGFFVHTESGSYNPANGEVVSCSWQPTEFYQRKETYTVPKERGYKCSIMPGQLQLSTQLAGHSSSFQAWWTNYVENGTGSSGTQYLPYTSTLQGSTSCSQSYYVSTENLTTGHTYQVKNWSCGNTGQSCDRNVFVY